jgi:hypothetical protein
MPNHPIFTDIGRGDLEEVKRRVLADVAELEEREGGLRLRREEEEGEEDYDG